MVILVTGSSGFIGKNLVYELKKFGHEVLEFNRKNNLNKLRLYCENADFVFHCAGATPGNSTTEEMFDTNVGLTKQLIEFLIDANNTCPILFTSSIQALHVTPTGSSAGEDKLRTYARTKKMAEDLILDYSKKYNVRTLIYQIPNVFGPGGIPGKNGVVTTFCHLISRNQEVNVFDENINIHLVYMDDLINEFVNGIDGVFNDCDGFCYVRLCSNVKLKTLVTLLKHFNESHVKQMKPELNDVCEENFYKTFLSYVPR